MLFDLKDVLIQPTVISKINSRSEINPYLSNGMLPLITAPMDTVISSENYDNFLDNKICVASVRQPFIDEGKITVFDTLSNLSKSRTVFVSYSLEGFKRTYMKINHVSDTPLSNHVLIDTANGHMQDVYDTVLKAKQKHGNSLVIMVGNIANPETYIEYAKIGVDYVRCSIGSGTGCLTSQQTSIGYPLGSLISECRTLKTKNSYETKIVADGGMKDYADIITALALGADLVMVGSLFNKAIESAGQAYFKGLKISDETAYYIFKKGYTITKKYRGMSTKEVQKSWGVDKLKTSEGVVRIRPVEYTLKGWVENFESYLKSTMSYTGSSNLNEFVGNVKYNIITDKSYKRFNK
jgi:IMP dehydrogenase/GMP reductase